MKIMCGRSGMLGDTVAALPIATFFRKKYPDAHLVWPIGKRFAQAASLYINQGIINEIFIFDGDEKPESERDWNMVKSCDIVINPTPEHADNIYPSQRTIYKESFLMAGLSESDWNSLTREEQRPKLNKWWNDAPKIPRGVIAIWPCAGYGRENKRNPSQQWYFNLVNKLEELDIVVWQFGHPKDFSIVDGNRNLSNESFFEQIKMSLECDLIVGTDSGSALILGAYEVPQISLLTNHWREDQNPHSLEVDNPNNFSFWVKGGCDNINIDLVIQKIVELVK